LARKKFRHTDISGASAVLVDRRYAEGLGDARGAEATDDAAQRHAALGVVVQACDDLDEGGLTGAVVTEDAGHLALPDGDVDPAQRMDIAVAHADVLELQDWAAQQTRLTLYRHRASAFFFT
jgi:hypothetical protein